MIISLNKLNYIRRKTMKSIIILPTILMGFVFFGQYTGISDITYKWVGCILIVLFVSYFSVGYFRALLFDSYDYGGTSDTNSDETAPDNIIKQLEQTQKSIHIFDDGNDNENSIYNNERVLSKIKEKLNAGVEISIHFNEQANLKINKLASAENLNIKYNPSERSENELHFRISDNGKYSYISRHKYDNPNRKYFLYDRSKMKLRFPFTLLASNHPMVENCLETFATQKKQFQAAS